MFKPILLATILILVSILLLKEVPTKNPAPTAPADTTPNSSPSPTLKPLPLKKTLENNYHIFQTFNNCGPAALSMALSYYNINKSQDELGKELRPYQNPQGNNDDKSVTLEEMAEKAKEYGLTPYHRPNGSIELIKKFVASDIPVITRTRLKEQEDIGHYRVVKGYDDNTKELIQDDPYQGKNLRFGYEEFDNLWKKFSYEYLVLIPEDKQLLAQTILGEDVDFKKAWEKALQNTKEKLEKSPDDVYARFNLVVALYNTGDYKSAADEFEKIEDRLPFRTLWYQIEPIQAYFELGDYQKVFTKTSQILNNQNQAFSELYFLRGQSYLKLNDPEAAKAEFDKAVYYNSNFAGKVPQL